MKLTPTEEQQLIISKAKTGSNLAIKAFAGSAKTTTCVMVAEELDKYSLYVAFNKSIAEEATTKFPSTVTARTMHSLAYGAIVTPKYRKKLQNWFLTSDVPTTRYKVAQATIDFIKLYCQSDYTSLHTFFAAMKDLTDIDDDLLDIDIIKNYWKLLISENSPAKITHDVYLKLFQLSKPILGFEVIYLDEAQDSNPVTLDIVLNQKKIGTQLIIVGDTFQSIYAWRGAIDAFDKLGNGFTELYLTESFRFTQDIADKAGKIIEYVGNNRAIKGNAIKGSISSEAVIARTNITIISTLLDASLSGKKVYPLLDTKILWPKLYHVDSLLGDKAPKYPDKELSQYKTSKQLYLAAETMPEIAKYINIVKSLWARGGTHSRITAMKAVLVKDPEEADYTLTTCHKSKGLEWDRVTLTNDFVNYRKQETALDMLERGQTANLIYVGITRGRYEVVLPGEIEELL